MVNLAGDEEIVAAQAICQYLGCLPLGLELAGRYLQLDEDLRLIDYRQRLTIYESQGRYEEAEPLLQQALALLRELLGDRHPNVATSLNNLAFLYYSQGRYEAAEPFYQQALTLWRELLGDRHPDVATSLNNLAGLYRSQGKYAEAEPLFQQALALRRELLGDRYPTVATSLNNLAMLYDII